jgi:hypothetical protein
MTFSATHLDAAQEHGFENRIALGVSEVCACFSGSKSFAGKELDYEISDGEGKAAFFPRWPVHSVIGSASGLSVGDPAFLTAVHNDCFGADA